MAAFRSDSPQSEVICWGSGIRSRSDKAHSRKVDVRLSGELRHRGPICKQRRDPTSLYNRQVGCLACTVVDHLNPVSVWVEIVDKCVCVGRYHKCVRAIATIQIVIAPTAQDVIAKASIQVITDIVVTSVYVIIAITAVQNIVAITAKQRVIPKRPKDLVIARAAINRVMTAAAVYLVISRAAEQCVVTDVYSYRILPVATCQCVVASTAMQLVIAFTTV